MIFELGIGIVFLIIFLLLGMWVSWTFSSLFIITTIFLGMVFYLILNKVNQWRLNKLIKNYDGTKNESRKPETRNTFTRRSFEPVGSPELQLANDIDSERTGTSEFDSAFKERDIDREIADLDRGTGQDEKSDKSDWFTPL